LDESKTTIQAAVASMKQEVSDLQEELKQALTTGGSTTAAQPEVTVLATFDLVIDNGKNEYTDGALGGTVTVDLRAMGLTFKADKDYWLVHFNTTTQQSETLPVVDGQVEMTSLSPVMLIEATKTTTQTTTSSLAQVDVSTSAAAKTDTTAKSPKTGVTQAVALSTLTLVSLGAIGGLTMLAYKKRK
jgi:hypothetical protein